MNSIIILKLQLNVKIRKRKHLNSFVFQIKVIFEKISNFEISKKFKTIKIRPEQLYKTEKETK